MTAFLNFFRKEFIEILRTWRIWVLPGLLLFAAVTGPVLAEITPALVRSLAADDPGVVIELPDPIPLDAYRQFASSLTQLALLALVISTAGIVSSEIRSGTAALVLTKPISRAGFIIAKVLSWSVLLLVAGILAAVICWLGTLAIFGDAPVAPLVEVTLLWLLYALMLVGVMTLLSTLISPLTGAAGAGIAVYFVFTILAQWQPTRLYTPGGVFHGISAVLDDEPNLFGPIVVSVVVAVVSISVAIWLFSRADLAARSTG